MPAGESLAITFLRLVPLTLLLAAALPPEQTQAPWSRDTAPAATGPQLGGSPAGERYAISAQQDRSRRISATGDRLHRHTEISGDGARDGDLIDAFYMDWAGCCDHDNGYREYPSWRIQKLSDAFHLAGRFVTLFSYGRSVRYPEGHRNLLFAQRGVLPLPRLPKMAQDSPSDARARHPGAVPVPVALQRTCRGSYIRHAHGHGLAGQRP